MVHVVVALVMFLLACATIGALAGNLAGGRIVPLWGACALISILIVAAAVHGFDLYFFAVVFVISGLLGTLVAWLDGDLA